MVIVRLRGGLGNQMFQYAMGKRMATKLNTELKLDLTSLLKTSKKEGVTNRDYQLHIFKFEPSFLITPNVLRSFDKMRLNFISQILKGIKSIGISKFKEKAFTVDHDLLGQPKNNVVYSGYWQSESYFKDIESIIREDFKFQEDLSDGAQAFYEKIKPANSVCLHVRRGDYVGNNMFNDSNTDYFYNGVKYLSDNLTNPKFFVFSDDPEWCKTNLKIGYDFTVVDYHTDKLKYKEDLQLMSSCKHFIISASSFSWWAVWLSNNKNKIVVAPKQWYLNDDIDVKDLVDKNWIRL